MATQDSQWIHAAALSDIPNGEAKAITIGDGRSIALFNVDGRFYATDNQCPHMGYPLTRGMVRHGILTCDWHGRSFDLEGGGCFNYECDDLQTFPVETRDGEIWIQVGDLTYKRRDEHLRLLWEGLLSEDRWTISKAIALLLDGGVPEHEIVGLILRHLGRHIASSHDAEQGGADVSRLISGLTVGRRYDGADRLMALSTAACASSGGAAERLDLIPLPPPVTWAQIESWVRMFSRNSQEGRIERCLFTARHIEHEDDILPLLYACAVEPSFLGFAQNLTFLSDLAEVVEEFGWAESSELVFNLGAKMIGRGRGEPERFHRDAVRMMTENVPSIQAMDLGANESVEYDEDALVSALVSVNIERVFDAVDRALKDGVKLDRLITTLVLLAADRMARTPVNVDAGWGALSTEFTLAASLRIAQRHGGATVAAKGLFHAAWLTFADRWLNIPARPLSEPLDKTTMDAPDEETGIQLILDSIQSLNVHAVGQQVLEYLNAGYSGDALLQAMGRAILWDDTSTRLLPTLRAVLTAWKHCNSGDPALGAGHPARYQLLVGLARYATDVRLNKNSQSAIKTALRFAEGKTTVEVFED